MGTANFLSAARNQHVHRMSQRKHDHQDCNHNRYSLARCLAPVKEIINYLEAVVEDTPDDVVHNIERQICGRDTDSKINNGGDGRCVECLKFLKTSELVPCHGTVKFHAWSSVSAACHMCFASDRLGAKRAVVRASASARDLYTSWLYEADQSLITRFTHPMLEP